MMNLYLAWSKPLGESMRPVAHCSTGLSSPPPDSIPGLFGSPAIRLPPLPDRSVVPDRGRLRPPLTPTTALAVLAALLILASALRSRPLILAWIIIVTAMLPIFFLPIRSGFVIYVFLVRVDALCGAHSRGVAGSRDALPSALAYPGGVRSSYPRRLESRQDQSA
jgi:hypothetical protein